MNEARRQVGGEVRQKAQALSSLIHRYADELEQPAVLMEVCGTHTVNLRKYGIHTMLPGTITLISGPGCPVCVTPSSYIDNALRLIEDHGAAVATFGDMVKVPGTEGRSLSQYMGTELVRIVYSPGELLEIAENSRRPVVFLGIGFETTIPVIASVFLTAAERKIDNLFLYPAFKTVAPALKALLAEQERGFNGFLLPGHVSVIIGLGPYRFLESPDGVPGVVMGFEPLDMLEGIAVLVKLLLDGKREIHNCYTRAVRDEGNSKARQVMHTLLEPADALWRGLGTIPDSGLALREKYARFDAAEQFSLPPLSPYEPPGCLCAQVIQGKAIPPDCSLFGSPCTPDQPVGPCMVSSEGTCAAYFRYGVPVRVNQNGGTRQKGGS